jgi:tRNA-binding protein
MKILISIDEFAKIDLRVGTVLQAIFFKEAKIPAYKLQIDFGSLGIKNSSAQLTDKYTSEELIGMKIIAVTNFPIKRIAGFKSECLVLAALNSENYAVLLTPQKEIPNGTFLT